MALRPSRRWLLLAALITAGLAAAPTSHAQGARPLLVFATASLQPVLGRIAADWERQAGVKVTLAFAASGALARQIEQGAPADVFASADLEWMDWAEARQLIRPATRRSLLSNTLVLIEPAGLRTSLEMAAGVPLGRLLGDQRLATGNPQSVPLGRYARAALTALGVWAEIAPRLAGTENARAALALVARGEARLGVVYGSDARSEPKVRVIATFPATSHPRIVYPFAVTAASRHPAAEDLLIYLASPDAARVLEAEGFQTLR
jgi:molybdate transport system substrate-binding protein